MRAGGCAGHLPVYFQLPGCRCGFFVQKPWLRSYHKKVQKYKTTSSVGKNRNLRAINALKY